MDDLLRYILLKVAVAILLFELLFIAGCLGLVVLMKIYYVLMMRRNQSIKDQLSSLFSKAIMENKTSIDLPKHLQGSKNLLECTIAFQRKITDESWNALKNHIVRNYLLETAEKNANSFLWTKRLLAAKCFTLVPSLADKTLLLRLLNDPILLVRVVAAETIVQLNDKHLFVQLIEKISRESKLAKVTYRDLLIHADNAKFELMIEILKTDHNPATASVCLDILSTRTTKDISSVLIPFLYGKDVTCRILAIRILKNIPNERIVDILSHALNDPDPKVREAAIQSLPEGSEHKFMDRLEEHLQDPDWFVRLQAALKLKELGHEGVKILSSQSLSQNPEAYEISQYTLRLTHA